MRKVGTLTFHFVENIGATLQCVALYKVLTSLGYDCKVINYCPEYHKSRYSVIYRPFETINHNDTSLIKIKKISKQLALNFRVPGRIIKKMKFSKFMRKNIRLSEQYKTINELEKTNEVFDTVIVGSDQVWNPMYTEGDIDEAYLLVFFHGIKVSYAASSGKILTPEILKKNLSLFRGLNRVSVREKSLANLLEEYKIQARIDIDPTLLLTSKEWDEICEPKSYIEEKYIFVYALEKNDSLTTIVEHYKKSLKIAVIDVSPRNCIGNTLPNKHVRNIGPEDFVAYIRNAAIIVTNSFHGTVFSIIYCKNFISVPHSKTPERVIDLLSSLNLSSRLCYDLDGISKLKDPNYDRVNIKLDELRGASLSYLKNI